MRSINVGILGFGTVSSGTVRILQENAAAITARVGANVQVKRVAVRDLSKPRDAELPASALTTNPEEITTDPDIAIVVELMGGVEPARSLISQAIAHGKSIVTANKEMVAKVGHELRQQAHDVGLDFLFEASVGGGIPVIATLSESLAGNRIKEIVGIVNGTTNYILTKMTTEGAAFGKVLAEAQALGYAEAEPSADVDGHDARYKIAILASLAFGTRVDAEAVTAEGIRHLSPRDIAVAGELGYRIKLLAVAQTAQNGIRVRVYPALLPLTHPLATVDGVFNAVFLRGDAVGDLTLIGRGAGALPTGSAVVGDIAACARNIVAGTTGRVPYSVAATDTPVLPSASAWSRYYARVRVLDRPKALATIATVFGDYGISIESVVQRAMPDEEAEIVWITHEGRESDVLAALTAIHALPVVRSVDAAIRVVA
ncbi:MAG: homoserine dehydrogenase [Armatimonadetes bacterium]|nr:homoserine dehydrogenase [Armatimonadota bacterium]